MKLKEDNKSVLLFYFSFLILLFVTFFSRVYVISDICKYLKFIALGMAIVYFFIQSKTYTLKSFVLLILIGVILVISSYQSKNIDLLSSFLLIASSKNIDFDKYIKFVFRWSIIFLIFVLLLHFFGCTNDYIDIRPNGVYRSSMGFAHPNTFGYILMIIAIEYIYIKRDKIKLRNAIVLIPYICIINYFSNSRSSTIVLIMLMIFIFFQKIFGEKIVYNKIIQFLIKHSFILLFLFISFGLLLYSKSNEFGNLLNDLLSKRLYWLNYYVTNYDISLFGQNIEIISLKLANMLNVTYAALDNVYYYILLNYGVIVFLLIAYAYRKLFEFFYKNHDTIEIILFLLINIYGLFEKTTIIINLNCFLIMFGIILYNKKKKEGEECNEKISFV